MKFDPSMHLKWIPAQETEMQGRHFNLINLCVLVAENSRRMISGFTVFEPRDFNEGFVDRLCQREKRPEFADQSFTLYLPQFLEHRAENIKKKAQRLKLVFSPFVSLQIQGNIVKLRDKIRIMNVDDSPVLLKFLKHTLGELGFFEVVGQVSDPKAAVAEILRLKPDMITMDIQMPGKTGVSVVEDLLSEQYFPVLMISSLAMEEGSLVFDALNAGAFDYIQKPKLEEKEHFKEDLTNKSLLAVEKTDAENQARKRTRSLPAPVKIKSNVSYPPQLLWCLGASTGGTQALTRVFTSLPTEIPPTLIVQHIPPVFSKAFADSLNKLCPFTVKEAEDGEPIKSNHVYIAPGGFQMGVKEIMGQLHVVISDAPPVNRFKPSVDYLFHEVAKLSKRQIVSCIFTGMGRDGAQGLLALKKKGAHTFAQDESTSTVFGMPRAALEIGAADKAVPLDSIAHTLLEQSQNFRKVA